MSLSRDSYRELEDILGLENISEDPAVLDGYAYHWGAFFSIPEAVVLPGSTKEVQAIIKLCNRRGIKYKAVCTGYGPHCTVGEGSILLDLRRMNRILEIDEKNMYIVVEPYVSFAQVQAEAMKRGLTCHVIGGGSQCSFLASHTSMSGGSSQGISQGFSGRNLLGVEWVLPTGEILRVGSPGSGAQWFSGDGPGPSLRGIMRGSLGATGNLGVFTKCACHLHPWPGPQAMEIKGTAPSYETEVPPFFEYHIIEWPSWDKYFDALYKIGEAGIGYALHKTGYAGSHGATVTGTNNEYWEKRQAGELRMPKITMTIVLAANSAGEHEYQVKVLDKIMEDTGGKIIPIGEEPTFKKRDYLHMVKGCSIPKVFYRLTGASFVDGMAVMESIDHTAMATKLGESIRDKYRQKGLIMDDDTDNGWVVVYEGGHFAASDGSELYDSKDMESTGGVMQIFLEGKEMTLKKPLNTLYWDLLYRPEVIGPKCSNYHNWMRKIKKAFDPNSVSGALFQYTMGEPPAEEDLKSGD